MVGERSVFRIYWDDDSKRDDGREGREGEGEDD